MSYDFRRLSSKNIITFPIQLEKKSGNFSQHSFSVFKKYSVSDKSCSFSITETNWCEMAAVNSGCHFSGQDFKHLRTRNRKLNIYS